MFISTVYSFKKNIVFTFFFKSSPSIPSRAETFCPVIKTPSDQLHLKLRNYAESRIFSTNSSKDLKTTTCFIQCMYFCAVTNSGAFWITFLSLSFDLRTAFLSLGPRLTSRWRKNENLISVGKEFLGAVAKKCQTRNFMINNASIQCCTDLQNYDDAYIMKSTPKDNKRSNFSSTFC